jgi:hypothetical protein
MQNKRARLALSVMFLLLLSTCARVAANDSAASTAAGGIQLTREPRVSMQKERLFISEDKVRVEYEFANLTTQNIETEVAFPIPDFEFAFDDPGGPRSMDDFKVWVEGKPVAYLTEIKTLAKGRDIAPLLKRYEVDANTFGHFDWDAEHSSDFVRLPANAQAELVKAGAFEPDEGHFPAWTVSKIYHWKQVFPASGILHVVHEYKPIRGFEGIQNRELDPEYRSREIAEAKTKLEKSKDERDKFGIQYSTDLDKGITNACLDAQTKAGIVSAVRARRELPLSKNEVDYGDYVQFVWVDYILTTANSWEMPIRDFELVIEKSNSTFLRGRSFVSFCWDGPVEKLDDRHFIARAKDFVPKRDLHVAFFH